MYRQLDDAKIIETLERLRDRIRERFPGSSLSRVSEELLAIARESASHIAYLQRPNWPVRVGVGIAIAAMLGAVFVALTRIRLQDDVGGYARMADLDAQVRVLAPPTLRVPSCRIVTYGRLDLHRATRGLFAERRLLVRVTETDVKRPFERETPLPA